MFLYAYLFYLVLLNVVISHNGCAAVIYHLEDSDYDRMPPLFALDTYEPCLRETNGVYCLVELELHGGPDNQLFSIIKNYSEHTVKHYNHTYIERGVCVSKTCQKFIRPPNKTAVLSNVLGECLNNSIWHEYGLEAKIRKLKYCDKSNEVDKLNISDWLVAGGFAAILMINVLGSLYDIFWKKKTGNQYLLCFSVLQNWQWLTSTHSSEPRMDRLKGLQGYRTIAICLMMIAHVMWVNSLGFTENTHDFEKAYESINYQLIFNGMMIIQIFIVQSGFLLAYNLLVRSEKQTITWKMYPKIILMRWWRLTPPYAVLLAFTATWLRHLGSGPLWRLWVADSVVADCRSYWWLHLLYVNNYVSADKFCAIQGWYLGAEMQMFAIGLIIFLVTMSRGRTLSLVFLLIVGLVVPALHVYFQDLDGVMIMDPEFYRQNNRTNFDVHIMGHNYLTCYAIGMGTACVLYHLQKQGIDRKTNKILQSLSWCFFPALACLFLGGRMFYADAPRTLLAVRALWAATHRLLMSGLVAFAILSIALRFSDLNCAVFECPIWTVPGRLCYCAFLVHLNFLHALVGTRAYLAQVSFYNMIVVYLGVVFLSFLAALPLCLLVEAPATRLMKNFTR